MKCFFLNGLCGFSNKFTPKTPLWCARLSSVSLWTQALEKLHDSHDTLDLEMHGIFGLLLVGNPWVAWLGSFRTHAQHTWQTKGFALSEYRFMNTNILKAVFLADLWASSISSSFLCCVRPTCCSATSFSWIATEDLYLRPFSEWSRKSLSMM